jgi:hypothetical protein
LIDTDLEVSGEVDVTLLSDLSHCSQEPESLHKSEISLSIARRKRHARRPAWPDAAFLQVRGVGPHVSVQILD